MRSRHYWIGAAIVGALAIVAIILALIALHPRHAPPAAVAEPCALSPSPSAAQACSYETWSAWSTQCELLPSALGAVQRRQRSPVGGLEALACPVQYDAQPCSCSLNCVTETVNRTVAQRCLFDSEAGLPFAAQQVIESTTACTTVPASSLGPVCAHSSTTIELPVGPECTACNATAYTEWSRFSLVCETCGNNTRGYVQNRTRSLLNPAGNATCWDQVQFKPCGCQDCAMVLEGGDAGQITRARCSYNESGLCVLAEYETYTTVPVCLSTLPDRFGPLCTGIDSDCFPPLETGFLFSNDCAQFCPPVVTTSGPTAHPLLDSFCADPQNIFEDQFVFIRDANFTADTAPTTPV